MKLTALQAALGSAALLMSAQPAGATHSHHLAHTQYGKKHSHLHRHQDLIEGPQALKKRGVCSLPDHPDLIKVPGQKNNGFAMSPDQECADGGYCPIACVPGKVMAQWKPNTTYKYPESMASFLGPLGAQVLLLTLCRTADFSVMAASQSSPFPTSRTAWTALALLAARISAPALCLSARRYFQETRPC